MDQRRDENIGSVRPCLPPTTPECHSERHFWRPYVYDVSACWSHCRHHFGGDGVSAMNRWAMKMFITVLAVLMGVTASAQKGNSTKA
jgi:hypothetical protein